MINQGIIFFWRFLHARTLKITSQRMVYEEIEKKICSRDDKNIFKVSDVIFLDTWGLKVNLKTFFSLIDSFHPEILNSISGEKKRRERSFVYFSIIIIIIVVIIIVIIIPVFLSRKLFSLSLTLLRLYRIFVGGLSIFTYLLHVVRGRR